MSRNEIDNLLMDYLYDELSPSERESFEQEIAKDESLREKVHEFQSTRAMLQRAAPPQEAPVALMQDLLRESRLAASTPEQAPIWERIANWLMRPSMATAMLVLVVAVTGVFLTQNKSAELTRDISAPKSPEVALESVAPTVERVSPPTDLEESGEPELADNSLKARAPVPSPEDADKDAPAEESGGVRILKEGTLGGRLDKPSTKMARKESTRYQKRAPRKRAKRKQRAVAQNDPFSFGAGNDRGATGRKSPQKKKVGKTHSLTSKSRSAEPAPATIAAQQSAKVDSAQGSRSSRNSQGYADAPEPDSANAPAAMQQMARSSNSAPAPPSQVVSQSADEKMEEAEAAPESKSKAAKDDNKKGNGEIAVGGSSTNKGDYELAIQHYKSKRYDKAIAEFKEFLNNNQSSKKAPAAEHNIARSYQRSNRRRRAMFEYQRLLKRFPNYRYRNAVLIETARLEMAMGQLDAARKHLKEAASDKSIAKEVNQLLSRVEREMKIRRKAQKKAKAKSASTSKKATKSSKEATKKAPAKTKSAPASKK